MLNIPSSSSFGQMRAYSSNSDGKESGAGFGFQSLGSLFTLPPSPGRYSRPKEKRAEEETSSGDIVERAVKEPAQATEAPKLPDLRLAETPDSIPGSVVEAASQQDEEPARTRPLVRKFEREYKWTAAEWKTFRSGEQHAKELKRVKEAGGSLGLASSGRKRRASRRPQAVAEQMAESNREMRYPFAPRRNDSPLTTNDAKDQPHVNAWGLGQQERGVTTPSATGTSALSNAEVKASISSSTASSGSRLTHVKPSGEAHMVDVGAKPSTKRTAIAIAHVRISPEVYKQIEENSNKKGDVLGAARIAGIMAAKRTSDIIPLCHPLAISKAEVDVYTLPENHRTHFFDTRVQALVAIQARVECVGPTGVEMEALTAVQGAALTVFDMCKAVDKNMSIQGARVVYKAGGRSGVMINDKWKKEVGVEKFTEAGELREDIVDLRVRAKQHIKEMESA